LAVTPSCTQDINTRHVKKKNGPTPPERDRPEEFQKVLPLDC